MAVWFRKRLDVTNHASALTKNAAGMLESDELDNDKMVCDRAGEPGPPASSLSRPV